MSYKKMYLHLFNKVTDALRLLEAAGDSFLIREGVKVLKDAQCECEDIYLYSDENFAVITAHTNTEKTGV